MTWLARKVAMAQREITIDLSPYHDGHLVAIGSYVGNDIGVGTAFTGPFYDSGLGDYDLDRSWVMFDTSVLGAGATIISAELRCPIYNNDFQAGPWDVYARKSAWTSPIDASQFNTFDGTGWESYHTIPVSAIGTVYVFDLPTLSWINKTGTTGYCLWSDGGYSDTDVGFGNHQIVMRIKYIPG